MLINGKSDCALSPLDRGLHYGDGLFETIAVVAGQPRLWGHHIERLQAGCTRLGLPAPDPALLLEESMALIGDQDCATLKILWTRGESERGYAPPADPQPTRLLALSPASKRPPPNSTSGVTVRVCSTPLGLSPALAGIKHLNRLEQVLARSEWQDPAIAEGVMLDIEGNVIEGTCSNLFLIRNQGLETPDLARCGVAGIMRKMVIRIAQELQIPVRVRPLSLAELLAADGLFLTNALTGISPVAQLGTHRYPTCELLHHLSDVVYRRLYLSDEPWGGRS